jgi:hypothetical protein
MKRSAFRRPEPRFANPSVRTRKESRHMSLILYNGLDVHNDSIAHSNSKLRRRWCCVRLLPSWEEEKRKRVSESPYAMRDHTVCTCLERRTCDAQRSRNENKIYHLVRIQVCGYKPHVLPAICRWPGWFGSHVNISLRDRMCIAVANSTSRTDPTHVSRRMYSRCPRSPDGGLEYE